MTNPIEHDQQDPIEWRLVLDNRERLKARPATSPEDPAVTLSMSPARAADLADVLDGYTRMAAVFDAVSQVSSTEEDLARALRDMAAAAKVTEPEMATGTKVTDGNRLRALEILQTARAELSHSSLLAIIDSAVRWLDEDMDYQAMDLLSAVDDEVGTAVYFTLIGHPMPVTSAGDEPTGVDKDRR